MKLAASDQKLTMSEKLYQIVDDADRVIGCKPRSTINPQTDIYETSCLWLNNPQGEILIARRGLMKHNDPGLWGPAVTGTVEQGEDYAANIYKKAEEELAFSDVIFRRAGKHRIHLPRHFFIQMFTATTERAETDFVLQAREVEGIMWVPTRLLPEMVRNNPSDFIPMMPQYLAFFGLGSRL